MHGVNYDKFGKFSDQCPLPLSIPVSTLFYLSVRHQPPVIQITTPQEITCQLSRAIILNFLSHLKCTLLCHWLGNVLVKHVRVQTQQMRETCNYFDRKVCRISCGIPNGIFLIIPPNKFWLVGLRVVDEPCISVKFLLQLPQTQYHSQYRITSFFC